MVGRGRGLLSWRRALLLGLLAACGSPGPGQAQEPQAFPGSDPKRPFSERQPFTVGVTTDSYPYGYIGHDGRWTGFSADLLDAVARVMNLRTKRVADDGRSLQRRFREGEFDLLQALSQTAEREAYADFSVPFLTLQGALFVRASDTTLERLEHLNGRRMAIVGKGSIGDQFVRDHGLLVEPLYVSSSEEALRLVERGAVAATFGSQLTALSILEQRGIRDVRMFGQPYADYDIRHCFAVHRGDAQLLARLNEGLAILHRSGEFQDIYDHWFGRLSSPMISREQVIGYSVGLLALAFVATLLALLRQRALRGRISRQALELRRQQALLQALYDNVPFSMLVLEAEAAGHRVLSLNRRAEELFGVAPAQAVGRRLQELPFDREWASWIARLLEREPSPPGLLQEEQAFDSLRRHLVATRVPLPAREDGRAAVCLLVDDVTERRQLDEEVARSRTLRAVGELVSGIAHEFNNLLTPISLKVGAIQLDWAGDRRLGQELAVIATASQRAAELTRRLLGFGRRSEPAGGTVELAQVVDNCTSLLRLTVDRRIAWQSDVPAGLPALRASPTDLNQVLLNLLLNARDTLLEKLAAAPAGWSPRIRIEVSALAPDAVAPGGAGALPAARGGAPSVEATVAAAAGPQSPPLGGWQRLSVHDNGMGMSPRVRDRIFEPFFTTKEVGRGTGLGLATVWHLVRGMGGRIDVDSRLGEGTAFHVLLPVTITAPKPASEEAPRPDAPTACARVFVAEDDELVLGAVTAGLARAGHTVESAADGVAAWNRLSARFDDFDVIVLDVNMPGLTGIELARRIRASGRYAGALIIISGRVSSDELRVLADARVSAVLSKPFEPHELQAAVARSLAATSTAS